MWLEELALAQRTAVEDSNVEDSNVATGDSQAYVTRDMLAAEVQKILAQAVGASAASKEVSSGAAPVSAGVAAEQVHELEDAVGSIAAQMERFEAVVAEAAQDRLKVAHLQVRERMGFRNPAPATCLQPNGSLCYTDCVFRLLYIIVPEGGRDPSWPGMFT